MKLFKIIAGKRNPEITVTNDDKIEAIEGVFGEEDRYNQFYGAASLAYRFLSFLMIACLLLSVIGTAFANTESFTFENLEYIFRNFAMQLEAYEDDSIYAIKYNPDTSRSYSLYKGGLAVCGNNGIYVYSATGRLVANEYIDFMNPVLLSGDKYLLVYDSGANAYTVLNSFSSVFSASTKYPIMGGAIADNGYYALISSTDEYNSVVELYDSNFALINRINKNGYITSVDISDKHLVVTTASVDAYGKFLSEIMIFDYMDKKEAVTAEHLSELPIYCSLGEDSFSVITNSSAYFYDINADLIGSYSYKGESLSDFDCHNGSVLLLFKDKGFGTDHKIVCLNKDSSQAFKYETQKTVFDIAVFNGYGYILTDDSVLRISDDELDESKFSGGTHSTFLIAADEDSLYVCTSSEAPLIDLD